MQAARMRHAATMLMAVKFEFNFHFIQSHSFRCKAIGVMESWQGKIDWLFIASHCVEWQGRLSRSTTNEPTRPCGAERARPARDAPETNDVQFASVSFN